MRTFPSHAGFARLVAGGLALLPFIVSGADDDPPVVIIGPEWSGPKPVTNGSPAAVATSPAPAVVAGLPTGVPVGTVVGWLKNQTNTPALPSDWVECNGQTLNLPGSPYHGLPLPDLNGVRQPPSRFLRGAQQSGGTGGAESHRHGGFLSNRSGQRVVNISAWTIAPHLPPYYDVVWILKAR